MKRAREKKHMAENQTDSEAEILLSQSHDDLLRGKLLPCKAGKDVQCFAP